MRIRALLTVALATVLCLPTSALAAPSAAAITGVSLSSQVVTPGQPLNITVTTNQPAYWRVDVVSVCGGDALRTLNGYASSSPFSVQWDGVDTQSVALTAGEYRVRVTLLDSGGAAIAAPVEQTFTVSGTAGERICSLVSGFGRLDVFHQGLVDLAASRSGSAVIGSATDVGNAAIASSYAHRFKLPLVLLTRTASLASLATALARHRMKAVVIGSPAAVSSTVDRVLRARRITVVRIGGADRAATAALIAARLKPAESSTATYVSLAGDPAMIAVATAYANALGVPLLDAGRTPSRATASAIRSLRLLGGVAIGDSNQLSDRSLAALPGVTRIIGKDLASTSFVLARALPVGKPALVLDSAQSADPLALIAQAQWGQRQLLIAPGGLPTAQQLWLTARADITGIVISPRISKATAIAVGRLIGDRGAIGALPALPMKPAAPVVVPAQFTFSGSGFGHGVGMSQWGAYGMAKEGNTATQILQHYFTGSVVAPIVDTMDVNVSLSSRVASQSFRLESLGDPASTLELTAADGTVHLLPINDVVTTRYLAGRIAVSVSGATPVPAFTTTSLTFRWPGNRDSGTATGGPALLRVAGPGVSIARGGRYRYGYVTVTVAKLSGALNLGLQVNNILRLHDEYLYGISEVSSSWPAAAIQAQIITARSYAYKRVRAGIRSACGCNVYDDPRDQNFTGYSKLAESGGAGARWKAAVDGTAVSDGEGLALTVGGQVVSAYYSAADGGKTQNNEDVWGGAPLSYTRSVDDPWSLTYAASSVSRWVPRSFSQAQLAAAFGAPDVAYLDLSNRYASGAVDVATAISSSGQRFTLGAETLKSRLNSGLSDAEVLARGIPSVWIWRVDTEVPTSSAAASAMQMSAGTTSVGARLPGAISSTVVLLQAAQSDSASAAASNPVLALASAYAGARGAGLFINTGATLDAAIRNELRRRDATQVVLIGRIPPSLVAALVALRIASVSIDAPTASALSVRLADALPPGAGSSVVLVSQQDARSQPLAVSLAARAHAPLLMLDGAAMSSDLSSYLAARAPTSATVVGSADVLPDALVAGLASDVTRLTTSDLTLASIVASSQVFDSSTAAVVVASPQAPTASLLIAAGSGLPCFFIDPPPSAESTTATTIDSAGGLLPDELMALIPRLPALTLVFRVGVDASSIAPLRNR